MTQLSRLYKLNPNQTDVLNDLAVALILKADRSQTLLPALQALDVAERAHARSPRDAIVLSNVALIQEYLRLPAAAYASWSLAEQLEHDASWRAEIRLRKAKVGRVLAATRILPSVDSLLAAVGPHDVAQLSTMAARARQWARDLAWSALSKWGLCTMQGDELCMARQRATLHAIARVEIESGGDQSVTLAVRQLDSIMPSGRRRQVASALSRYGAALDFYRHGRSEQAIPLLRSALSDLGGSTSAVGLWAQYYLGGSLVSRGEYDGASRMFRKLIVQSGSAMPALAGKSRLALGVIEGRRGDSERATDWIRSALPVLELANDDETQGFAAFLLAETLAVQGRRLEGFSEALRSMRINYGRRASTALRSQVSHLADLARGEHLPFAALSISHESVAIARTIGRAPELALAYRDRARAYRTAGRDSLSMRDLDSAESWNELIEGAKSSDRLRAYILLGRGEVLRASSPAHSVEPLMRSVAILRDFQDDVFLPVALHQAALTMVLAGDTVRAEKLVLEAILVLEDQVAKFQSATTRATFAETFEDVFDTMISLQIAQSRSRSALEFLERSRRTAYTHAGKGKSRRPAGVARFALSSIQRSLSPQTTVLMYAVLADRVAIWRLSADSLRLVTVSLSHAALMKTVSEFQSETKLAVVAQTAGASSNLYDLLLRPVLESVPAGSQLVIVPDRELFQLSFSSLWDRVAQRFVVEQYELRHAPSAEFMLASSTRKQYGVARARILVVGNDAKSSMVSDSLPVLGHAQREADGIAKLYTSHELLTGKAVTRSAIRGGVEMADILHFAGHSVFDASYPERSYLLISGAGESSQYTAGEIALLRASKLRLVILSACSTLNSRSSRVGPVSGLAYSFLQAGAAGTITSLWEIDDDGAREFMTSLHRQLRDGSTPAAALRHAQLEFLRSTDVRRRSPRVWAAFTLTGI